jgi:SAM-dependent methyltransferase
MWESALRPLFDAPDEALWRTHSDAIHAALLARWLPAEHSRQLLKTDLFDEAMGDGLVAILTSRARLFTGLDITPSVVATALAKHPGLQAVTADVRQLPFARETFDVIVSNSTLDHFEHRDQIRLALSELHSVLRRGGRLLLTLDNLANPVVALRAVLPFRLLRRLRLAEYPAGATCGPWLLRRMLRETGFEVLDTTTLLHCPRVAAMMIARRVQRTGTTEQRSRLLCRLLRWEKLGELPTRFFTGYYVAISACKP